MRKILFHHIPKTAGTALVEHAERHFGKRVCPARYDSDISVEMIQDPAFVFYHGHFTRPVVNAFRVLHPDMLIFTFVRHPFTRILSQYYNWTDRARVTRELSLMAERGSAALQVAALQQKFEQIIFHLSLDDFLTSADPDVSQVVNNLQAQYFTEYQSQSHVRFNNAAFNIIATYDFVGLQELYEPCLRLVESKCGMPSGSLGGTERINCSEQARISGRYHVTAQQLLLLGACSVYDMAVFHLCHALLLKQYGGHLPPEARDVDLVAQLPIVDDAVASARGSFAIAGA